MTMTVDLNAERFVPYTSQHELLALQKMFPTCVKMGGADFGVVMSASFAKGAKGALWRPFKTPLFLYTGL